MKKPESLRAHLAAYLPALRKHPDKLHVFVDKGTIATKRGAGLGFEYRYTLSILFTDYTEPADTIIVPLLVWIDAHQPDLIDHLDKRDRAIGFEAELIDHRAADIEVKLELTERVLVRPAAGGHLCEHLGEPHIADFEHGLGWRMLGLPDPETDTAPPGAG